MRKAVSGKVMTILIEVLLALLAIVLVWVFHEKIFDFMNNVLLEGIKNFIWDAVWCKLSPTC